MSDVLKTMVDRFLAWKLPNDFAPDCGIRFDAEAAKKLDPRNARYEPVGTNLLTAGQARAMLEHVARPLLELCADLRMELSDLAYRPQFDDGQDHEDGEPRLTGWECLCCGALEPRLRGFDHLDGCVLGDDEAHAQGDS